MLALAVAAAGLTLVATGGATAEGASPQRACPVPVVAWLGKSVGRVEGSEPFLLGTTVDAGITQVLFGDTPAEFTRAYEDVLSVAAPPHPRGDVAVRLVSACGTSVPEADDTYRYLDPPVVTGLSVTEGPTAGGTVLTVTGRRFVDVTSVNLDPWWGRRPVASWTQLSPTELRVTMTPFAAGPADLTVTGQDGTGEGVEFSFVPPPRVAGLSVHHASTAGGVRVRVTGTDLATLGEAPTVRFGGVAGTDLDVRSPSELWVTAPAQPAGVVDVVVSTPAGASGVRRDTVFTYEPVTPTAGRLVEPPVPADGLLGSAQLAALACPSPGACWAVGAYHPKRVASLPLLERQGPDGWVPATLPLPRDASFRYPGASLLSLDCPLPDFCAAVGSYNTEERVAGQVQTEAQPLLATWDGTSWQSAAVPVSYFADDWEGYEPHLACTTSRTCVVVSHVSTAITYVGGRWRPSPLPVSGDAVRALDCAATRCVAVGATGDPESSLRPLVLRWQPAGWTRDRVAPPAGARPRTNGLLTTVACPVDDGCVAAGSYRLAGYRGRNLSATLGADGWTTARLPRAAGEAEIGWSPAVRDIVCVSVERCAVTASYALPTVHPEPDAVVVDQVALITSRDGAWRNRPVTLPGADPYETYAQLQTLACREPGRCLALATYDQSDGRTRGLVARTAEDRVQDVVHLDTGSMLAEQWPGLLAVAFDSPTTAVAIGTFRDGTVGGRSMLVTDLPLD